MVRKQDEATGPNELGDFPGFYYILCLWRLVPSAISNGDGHAEAFSLK